MHRMKIRNPVSMAQGGTHSRTVLAAALLVAASSLTARAANAPAGPEPAFKPYADIRYRLELVDQGGLPEDATASTLRVRLGVRTREWQGLSAVLEGEGIVIVGGETFNSTVNGRTQYPVVADPEDSVVNQAFLRWRPNPRFELAAGRQALNLDNQRWVGSVGWRQNDQTLDAAGLAFKPVKGLALNYNYVWRVNRVFGKDSPVGVYRDNDIHLLRLSQDFAGFGALSVYGYLLDIPDAPAASSQTIGLRFAGNRALTPKVKLLYAVEYARQSEYGDNPRDFGLDYWLIEPGIGFGAWTAKLGFEQLEGNGSVGLQTPLATLHAFNGWTDKFLTTPANGLRDVYADVSWKLGGPGLLKDTSLRLVYHDYDSVEASASYGDEWDLQVSHPIGKRFSALLKYADYGADAFATDTQKFWVAVEAKF